MSGYFRRLDTKVFMDIINSYGNQMNQFETIVQGVNATTNEITAKWKGKGRDAFEKDCTQVRRNLQDITDIMGELRLALINAQEEYSCTDMDLATRYESD